jgi:hypothetical protein
VPRQGLAVLVLVLAVECLGQTVPDQPPVLTVCEALTEPSRYGGRSVIIVGRLVRTSEGAWLSEDCGLKVINGGKEFQPVISAAYDMSQFDPPPPLPKTFRWDGLVLRRKLSQVRKTTRLRSRADVWAAEFGRLETKLPWPRRPDDAGSIFGFGHLNGAPAQLIGPEHGLLVLK